jgi:hypothetical protein
MRGLSHPCRGMRWLAVPRAFRCLGQANPASIPKKFVLRLYYGAIRPVRVLAC